MQIHIMLFIYNFSVFLGLCCICLAVLMKYINKTSFLSNLINFLVALFTYGLFNLVLYYKLHIVELYYIEHIFSLATNITFILIFYFWLRFIHSKSGTTDETGLKVFKSLGLACALIWSIDIFFFMDIFYNVQVKWGNYLSTLSELLLYIAFLALTFYYLFILLKTKRISFILIQSIFNALYFTYILLKDIRISFFSYNSEMWSGQWLSIGSIFCLLTNASAMILLCYMLLEQMNKRKEALVSSEKLEITLEEVEEQYHLSKREMEVFRLMINGYPNQSISELLFISTNTLKKHINSIFKKMNIKSRLDLIQKFNCLGNKNNE